MLVPYIADLQEVNKGWIKGVYAISYRLVFFVTVPLFLLMISLTPVISQIWIGRYETIFVGFSGILSIGYLLNILSYPAFLSNLGIGELNWNTVGYLVASAANVLLGLSFGMICGAYGVVAAWALSLASSGFIISAAYCARHDIPLKSLFPKESVAISLTSICGVIAALAVYHGLKGLCGTIALTGIVPFVFLSFTAMPVWLHPMRSYLTAKSKGIPAVERL